MVVVCSPDSDILSFLSVVTSVAVRHDGRVDGGFLGGDHRKSINW